MDLMTFLTKLEADFFGRLDRKTGWGKNEVKKEFNEALRNTLVTTYTRVVIDAKEGGRSDS